MFFKKKKKHRYARHDARESQQMSKTYTWIMKCEGALVQKRVPTKDMVLKVVMR